MKYKKSSKPNALKMSKRLRWEVRTLLAKAPIGNWSHQHYWEVAEVLFDGIDRSIRVYVKGEER